MILINQTIITDYAIHEGQTVEIESNGSAWWTDEDGAEIEVFLNEDVYETCN